MTTIKIENATLSDIKRRSLFGRSQWVFWNGRAARFSVDSIRAAMRAVGTQGKFFTVEHGVAAGWRTGCA